MPKIPIVPMEMEKHSPLPISTMGNTLPLFYMSDYSILGLQVSHYNGAIRTLKALDYRLDTGPNGIQLVIADVADIKEVIRRLGNKEIVSQLTDIVTDIYQG